MATKKSGGSRKNTPRGSNTARKTSKSNSSYTTSRQRQEALAKEARQDRAKRKRTWKTIGIAFLVLILLAVLGFAGFGIAYVVTDGFGGKVPTAVIMIEDDMYTASADGIAIYPGDGRGAVHLARSCGTGRDEGIHADADGSRIHGGL